MATAELIKGVSELLADVTREGAVLLDISCQRGELLQYLRTKGFTVRGTNFERVADGLRDIAIDDGVDILRGLPYGDETFDVVLLVEVIEHLENHRQAIAELARVLKVGGVLILTTPNIMRLNSRLHFLLTGYHKPKRRFIPFCTPLAAAHRYHNHPVTLPLLCYFVHQHGLIVEKIGRSRIKAFSWALFFLLGPLVAAWTFYALVVREKERELRRENVRLLRWLLHPRVLLEDNLLLRLRKAAFAREPADKREGSPCGKGGNHGHQQRASGDFGLSQVQRGH